MHIYMYTLYIYIYTYIYHGHICIYSFPDGTVVKNLPAMQVMQEM